MEHTLSVRVREFIHYTPYSRRGGVLENRDNKTPQAPHGHPWKGGSGGRLHGNCGSKFGDNEQHRICSACVAKDVKRKAPAADTGGRGQSKRPKVTNGGSKKSQPSRKGPRVGRI
ncbi:unnamed protein product [Ectocarpus sp. CCAP 1310/34]|nr:unnamed protein product [Ectocarpus sp. CCAP 1310/34]